MENNSHIVFDLPKYKSAEIKVIGVGGGGSNAVNHMYEQGITGVDFVICNTDAQALNNSPIPNKIQLGIAITEGLGAGANPEVGEQSALESMEELKSVLDTNTKMVFITAGMGGGTGTGAAPIIAGMAKEMGILTVGIVTMPFLFEGKTRINQAKDGIDKLRDNVDSLIVINNNKLRELYGNLGHRSAYAKADEVLTKAAKGIAEVITHHYRQNIDLKDAKAVLSNSGTAIMGSANAAGENKAKDVITSALDSPLLDDNKITGAKNVLLLIVSGEEEVTLDEIGIISDYIQEEAGNNANIIMGIGEDETLGDAISVTVVATGFPTDDKRYTGKEEEKIFHTLSEDQPLTKTLELNNTPSNLEVNPESERIFHDFDIEAKQESTTDTVEDFNSTTEPDQSEALGLFTRSNNKPETSFEKEDAFEEYHTTHSTLKDSESKKIVYTLDETIEDDYSIEDFAPYKKEKTEQNIDSSIQLKNVEKIGEIDSAEEMYINSKVSESIEQEEEEMLTVPNEIVSSKPTNLESEIISIEKPNSESETENFEKPIGEVMQKTIEERRNRLKKYNYKFQNSLQSLDKTPAYKRQNIELNEKSESITSQYVVGQGKDGKFKLKPNTFLNNNVD